MGALANSKAERLAVKLAAIDSLVLQLRGAAPSLGGRFILFGSAARGELRFDSDVDLLLDFPDAEATRLAWDFAEQACGRLKLPYDIVPVWSCSPVFLEHVMKQAKPIPCARELAQSIGREIARFRAEADP